MIKWEDRTSYSRSNKERVPSILETNVRGLRIVVHRIRHEEGWYLSVYKLNINDVYLGIEDLEKAKIKGLEILANEILKLEKIRDVLVSNLR